jgi:hypothetical protein
MTLSHQSQRCYTKQDTVDIYCQARCSPDETATLFVVAKAQAMAPRCPEQSSFADGEMPPYYYVYPCTHAHGRAAVAGDQQAFKE